MEIDKVFDKANVDGVADNLFSAVRNSVSEIKAMQQRKAAENVQLVIQALKKIESDLQGKFDGVTTALEKRVSTIKDGRDGAHGRDGRDGKDGRPGKDGAPGPRGKDGAPGKDGVDGVDGISVVDARIDFDGSLIIGLSSGREINVGEVVAPDLAERIKVITNGGGTSQSVLDTLASLQSQINALDGFLDYKGTWNASTNTPTLVSSTGTKGDYYVVSVAGSTNLNGETTWGVGDWVVFNNSVWQKVDGGSTGNFTTAAIATSLNLAYGTASTALALDASKNVVSVTNTGTGNNVLAGSPTLTGTVNAAAVTMSSNLTLSGGTANGVTYLNGSKVLTSGSALTFDGFNQTITAATNGVGFRAKGSASSTNIDAATSRGGTIGLFNLDTTNGNTSAVEFYNSNELTSSYISGVNVSHAGRTGAMVFGIANGAAPTEQMRLTSTGLGIGTSSPAQKLHVLADTSGALFQGATLGGVTFLKTGQTAMQLFSDATGTLKVYDNNSGSAVVTVSSGNLGLGVTPSAWRSTDVALQVRRASLWDDGSNAMYLGQNVFENTSGSYIYIGSDYASIYRQQDGAHAFYTAASGTAGNAITFTQAMTLTAAGDLGVGATSPAARLDLGTPGNVRFINAENGVDANFRATFSSNTVTFANTGGSGVLAFQTGGSERARIDSSGNLLVGATSGIASERLFVSGSNANYIERVYNSNASPYGIIMSYTGAAPNGTVNEFFRCDDTGAVRMSVRSNGGIANYQANDVNLSDRREKTNFAPAKSYLETICAIPVQTFNYIDQAEDDPGLTLGVVAQDVQAVAPELVMESNWGTEEEPKMRLSIYQTDLQYALMKALQELKAEFDAYKASHP